MPALKVLVNKKLKKLRSAHIVDYFRDFKCRQIVSFLVFLSSAEMNGDLQFYNTAASSTQATFISS